MSKPSSRTGERPKSFFSFGNRHRAPSLDLSHARPKDDALVHLGPKTAPIQEEETDSIASQGEKEREKRRSKRNTLSFWRPTAEVPVDVNRHQENVRVAKTTESVEIVLQKADGQKMSLKRLSNMFRLSTQAPPRHGSGSGSPSSPRLLSTTSPKEHSGWVSSDGVGWQSPESPSGDFPLPPMEFRVSDFESRFQDQNPLHQVSLGLSPTQSSHHEGGSGGSRSLLPFGMPQRVRRGSDVSGASTGGSDSGLGGAGNNLTPGSEDAHRRKESVGSMEFPLRIRPETAPAGDAAVTKSLEVEGQQNGGGEKRRSFLQKMLRRGTDPSPSVPAATERRKSGEMGVMLKEEEDEEIDHEGLAHLVYHVGPAPPSPNLNVSENPGTHFIEAVNINSRLSTNASFDVENRKSRRMMAELMAERMLTAEPESSESGSGTPLGASAFNGNELQRMLQQVRNILPDEQQEEKLLCTFCGAVLLPSEKARVARDKLEGKVVCCEDCREYA